MQPTVVGLFTGLLLGIANELDGFGAMLLVALFGAIGFILMKVIEGEIDVSDLIDRTRRPPQR